MSQGGGGTQLAARGKGYICDGMRISYQSVGMVNRTLSRSVDANAPPLVLGHSVSLWQAA